MSVKNTIKKRALRAHSPFHIFRDSKGREVRIHSKATLGQLARIGVKVHLGAEVQPGDFEWVGEDRRL